MGIWGRAFCTCFWYLTLRITLPLVLLLIDVCRRRSIRLSQRQPRPTRDPPHQRQWLRPSRPSSPLLEPKNGSDLSRSARQQNGSRPGQGGTEFGRGEETSDGLGHHRGRIGFHDGRVEGLLCERGEAGQNEKDEPLICIQLGSAEGGGGHERIWLVFEGAGFLPISIIECFFFGFFSHALCPLAQSFLP